MTESCITEDAVREAESIIAEVDRKRKEINDYRQEHGIGSPDSWIVTRRFGQGRDALMAEVARLLIAHGGYQVRTSPTQTETGPILVVLRPHPYGSLF